MACVHNFIILEIAEAYDFMQSNFWYEILVELTIVQTNIIYCLIDRHVRQPPYNWAGQYFILEVDTLHFFQKVNTCLITSVKVVNKSYYIVMNGSKLGLYVFVLRNNVVFCFKATVPFRLFL